jgi:hypothetical protein
MKYTTEGRSRKSRLVLMIHANRRTSLARLNSLAGAPSANAGTIARSSAISPQGSWSYGPKDIRSKKNSTKSEYWPDITAVILTRLSHHGQECWWTYPEKRILSASFMNIYYLRGVCPSICPSVCPHAATRLPLNVFSWKVNIWDLYSNLPRKLKLLWNRTKISDSLSKDVSTFILLLAT